MPFACVSWQPRRCDHDIAAVQHARGAAGADAGRHDRPHGVDAGHVHVAAVLDRHAVAAGDAFRQREDA